MRFIGKHRKSWRLVLLVVALVMLAWLAVSSAQGATITVTSTADSGPGTLREALTTAVNGDTIVFDPTVFPPSAPATIALTSPLPDITQGNLTIDGSGAGVIIDGSGAGVIIDGSGTPGDTAGISITSNGNTIKGLQILNFPGSGVEVWNGAQSNTIGGDTPGERNVISGNGRYGVHICDEGTDGNVVSGNYIGTDASGTAPLANEESGVQIDEGAQNNTIGGSAPGEGNVIAHNEGVGVLVDGSATTGNTISRNSITANDGLGIDNVNGGNTELPPPVITEALTMTVSGTACAGCTVEVFSDNEDEGEIYEGTTTADVTGAFTWTGSITGPNVNATATDGAGNTSEFAFSIVVPGSVPVIPQTFDLIAVRGDEPMDLVISPDGGRAYVPTRNTDNLFVIDLATNQIIEVIDLYPEADHPLGPKPERVAITPDGSRLLVTNANDHSLTVIDTATNTVVRTRPMGGKPPDVAISPDGSLAYVSIHSPDTIVKVIDVATAEVLTAIGVVPDAWGPLAVAFAPDGSRAYVAMMSGAVLIIDPATHTFVGSIAVPDAGEPGDALVISADGKTGYLASLEGNKVIVLDLVNNQVADTFAVVNPIGLTLNADGSRLYVGTFGFRGEWEYNICMFDTQSGEVVAGATFIHPAPYGRLGSDIEGLALTPDGVTLYAASVDADGVFVVDSATLEPIGMIPTQAIASFLPLRAVISPDDRYLYVGGGVREPTTVSVIDTKALQVVGEIVSDRDGPCADASYGLDLSPDGGTLYVLSSDGNCVLVVDTQSWSIVDDFRVGVSGLTLTHIVVHPDGDRAYVLDSGGNVYMVDLESRGVLSTLATNVEDAYTIKLSPDGTRAYVTWAYGFAVLDVTTNTLLKLVDFGREDYVHGWALGVKPDSSQYVVYAEDKMHVYDAASDEEIRNIEMGAWLVRDIIFSPDSSTGYLAEWDDKAVIVFDANAWQVTAEIDVGRAPYFGICPTWLVLSPDGSTLYAVAEESDNVVVIDTATNTVAKTIRVGRPYHICLPLITKNYQ